MKELFTHYSRNNIRALAAKNYSHLSYRVFAKEYEIIILIEKITKDIRIMLTKTKKYIQIPREDWEKMRKNPAFKDAVELLEDIADLEKAKKIKGNDLTFEQYLKKRSFVSLFSITKIFKWQNHAY